MTYNDADHKHEAHETSHERAFAGCVATDACDPRSHGGVTYTHTCRCGVMRHVNSKDGHTEIGGWYNPHEP